MTSGSEELVSIGRLSDSAGISADAIRVWERRFGRPAAIRLPSGHRRYPPEEVRWLRRISYAIAMGHRAAEVIPLSDPDLDRLLSVDATPPEDRAAVEEILAFVRAFDVVGLRERLRREWGSLGPIPFLVRRVFRSLAAVGRRWAEGRLSVRHEHFLSAVVEDFLRARRLEAEEPNGPVMLFATLPGERHQLGLQAAALVAKRAGARARVLGPDTPAEEILAAAEEAGAVAVCLSVSLATGSAATDRRIVALRRALSPETALIVGGAGARRSRRGRRHVEYREDLVDFERRIVELVRRRV